MALNSLEEAEENGWHVGYTDYASDTETPNPFPKETLEHSRWWSGYDMGYYSCHRNEPRKEVKLNV
jgi:hypothetical protein